jgi:serine/threonine protein kinase
VLTCLRISLLCFEGSDGPAKQAEKKCYEGYHQSARDKHQAVLDKLCEKLDFAAFTKEEWERRGEEVPKKNREKKMARLGKGAFMTAYRMKNAAGDFFAVKIVKTEDMKREGITEADMEREARTLERMKHTHVIRYYRQPGNSLLYKDEDKDRLGIVMEWARGGSLADLIKARKERGQNVGMRELLNMNIQIAKALAYIHDEGILHRDVKADNVLLKNAEGGSVHIKLADFGVAAVLSCTAGSKRHTQKGTDVYYSPEKARSKAYGSKDDMWAAGCIIIELACCERLDGALWSVDDLEVQDRRNKYFTQVRTRDSDLADIAQKLLDRDTTSRLSAPQLQVSLEKNCLQQDQQEGDVALGSGGCVSGAVFSEPVKNQKKTAEQGQAAPHPNKKQKFFIYSKVAKGAASVLSPPQQTLKNCHEQDQQTGNVVIGSESGAACSEAVKTQNTKSQQGQAAPKINDLKVPEFKEMLQERGLSYGCMTDLVEWERKWQQEAERRNCQQKQEFLSEEDSSSSSEEDYDAYYSYCHDADPFGMDRFFGMDPFFG